MKLQLALSLIAMAAVAAIAAAHTLPAHSARHAIKRVLVVTVTKGFRHDSIPDAEETIKALGDQSGHWETDFVRTDEEMQQKMTPQALNRYDAVIFANTTGVLPLPDPQGFLDYIKAGHGFAAMHSGSDTFHQWPGAPPDAVSAYVEMLGGEFLTHHAQSAIAIHFDDPNNPATRAIAAIARRTPASHDLSDPALHEHTFAEGGVWKVFDEIYLLKNNPRTGVHVLLSIDHYPNDGSAEANQPGDHLVSWVKSYGAGKVFYTILGHRKEVWHDPLYQRHIQGGIDFVLGLGRGSTSHSSAL